MKDSCGAAVVSQTLEMSIEICPHEAVFLSIVLLKTASEIL